MTDVRYTSEHEWVRLEENEAIVGVTDHAQDALGDIVFVELPEPGRRVAAGESCAVVESVKAASDVFAPLAGVIAAVNAALADDPALVNSAAEGEGWLFRIELDDTDDFDELLDAEAYAALLEDE
jgi:glycine cleavage system H protein